MRCSDVGRNKSARRQQGLAFPALPGYGMPETPVPRSTRGQAYSGLLRDVYNDERAAWECSRGPAASCV
jgi:hypothetical protein